MDIGALKGFGCLSLPAGQVSSESLAPIDIGVAKHRRSYTFLHTFWSNAKKYVGFGAKPQAYHGVYVLGVIVDNHFFEKRIPYQKPPLQKRICIVSTANIDYCSVIDILPFIEGRFQRSLPPKQCKFGNHLFISSLHATTSTASACNGSSQLKIDNRTMP